MANVVQYEVLVHRPGTPTTRVVISVPAGTSPSSAAKAQFPGCTVTVIKRIN